MYPGPNGLPNLLPSLKLPEYLLYLTSLVFPESLLPLKAYPIEMYLYLLNVVIVNRLPHGSLVLTMQRYNCLRTHTSFISIFLLKQRRY